MNVVALIANFIVPGVGTLIMGKMGLGVIQLILFLVGLILTFTFIGAIVGVPLCVGAWVWGLVTVVRNKRYAQATGYKLQLVTA